MPWVKERQEKLDEAVAKAWTAVPDELVNPDPLADPGCVQWLFVLDSP